ncbi:hypothetical protein TEQG_08832 [Trichophyton equinum CBS 127.97]|uniref:Uncharacterized protein n=1 Tax=Trichophyton equinum (strain ATCC MYA-4606 / CBS 127.97) TaxID=559882 RepID=F2Q4I3_TRIEC|nr:hypothetical protein TEQG_08832 [Trichophyton equinum CBS 127.97]
MKFLTETWYLQTQDVVIISSYDEMRDGPPRIGVTKRVLVEGSGDYLARNDTVRAVYLCYLGDHQNQQGYSEEKQIIIPGDSDYKDFCIGEGSVIPVCLSGM